MDEEKSKRVLDLLRSKGDWVDYHEMLSAFGIRHGTTWRREYGPVIDRLVSSGKVRGVPSHRGEFKWILSSVLAKRESPTVSMGRAVK